MPLPDNEQINKEFVAAVEEFPVLYNYNLKNYSNRNEQDKAWRQLASKFKVTDSECKLRYKNIRGALSRYLRNKNKTGSSTKKPYYLWKQLQFLLPYTKSKLQSGNLGLISTPHPQDEPADESEEEDDHEEQTQSSYLSTNVRSVNLESGISTASAVTPLTAQTSTPSSTLSAWRSSKIKTKKDDPLEKAVTSYYERKRKEQKEQGSEADLNFFQSFLPDIKHFSPAKKRLFKRKVIEIIDELSEDDLSTQSANGTPSRTSSINSFTRDNWPTLSESTFHPVARQEFSPTPTQHGSMVAVNATQTTTRDYFTNSQGWNFDNVHTEPYNYIQTPTPNIPTTTK